ncbi:MAG: disulfide bond formation protein B, partial [Acinetobacter towneri]
SLPVWSLLFFSVLAIISLWQLLRNYPFVASTTLGKVKKK